MEATTMLPAAVSAQDLELAIRILFQVVLLVSSAFFSGSETALFSLSRLDLQKLRNTRNPHSDRIHEMLDEPRRLIISILCGNELVNIASAANMAAILLLFFTKQDAGWINIIVMVPLLLLVGEVTPKTFAVTFPIKFAANISARLLPKWMIFITPLREIIRFIADRLTTLIVGQPVMQENILHRDEFRTLVDEGASTGALDGTERVLIDNMLEAAETEIFNIMTPRTRLHFINADDPMPKILKRFRKYRHPRVPVIRNHADNILGMLHSEDVLRLVNSNKWDDTLKVEEILRPAHFVPPTKKVDEMFEYFQHHNTRAAIVLGEFGGVSGIITMKDVLTFIFGEISGAGHGKAYYSEQDDNCYTVPGDMRLTDFEDLTNFGIADSMMTTIGGVAFRLFDRLPKVEDTIVSDGMRYSVLEMDGLRIKTLRIEQAGFGSSVEEEAQQTDKHYHPSVVEVDESGHAPTDHRGSDPDNAMPIQDDDDHHEPHEAQPDAAAAPPETAQPEPAKEPPEAAPSTSLITKEESPAKAETKANKPAKKGKQSQAGKKSKVEEGAEEQTKAAPKSSDQPEEKT
uniref:Uncharacterized protein n=1 Tax=Magnetococcus massalia (strain MO-1) TaxID=451514 RepID=A0A1S7LQU7_MAGMO|nr:Protein of unknown function. putative cystathionine beta-synthase (CBS) domain containing protein [Candidatus Magnetococcus massalia]